MKEYKTIEQPPQYDKIIKLDSRDKLIDKVNKIKEEKEVNKEEEELCNIISNLCNELSLAHADPSNLNINEQKSWIKELNEYKIKKK